MFDTLPEIHIYDMIYMPYIICIIVLHDRPDPYSSVSTSRLFSPHKAVVHKCADGNPFILGKK
jgi:hypothetical protein